MVNNIHLKSQLQEGLLNRFPLPFEQTIQKISNAQSKIDFSQEALELRFLRNLNEKEIDHVLRWAHYTDDIPRVAKQIKEGVYGCSIFKEKRFAQLAMGAYVLLEIQRNELANLLLRYSAYLQFGEQFQIFRPGDNDYDKVLERTFWKTSVSERDEFRREVKKLVFSERVFWTVTLPSSRLHKDVKKRDWAYWFNTVAKYLPYFAFQQHPTLENHQVMVIPTIGIFQVFLKTIFKADAVILEPELLKACNDHITMDLMQNRWPIMLNFPGLQRTEKRADGYPTGEYGVSHHDFYHAYRISTIPFNHRYGFFRQRDLLLHSIALKTLHPQEPLLKLTWPKDDHSIAVVESDENIEKLNKLVERFGDLDVMASPYAKDWTRNRLDRSEKNIYFPSFNPPFARFALTEMKLNREEPKSLPFQYAVLIHDMVIHKSEWWQQFRIYTSEETSEWTTEGQSVAPTVYAGFRV